MRRLDLFLSWLYVHLLRLYPTDFYAQYAEEMGEIFRLRLQDSRRHQTLIAVGEIVSLVPAIAREHLSHRYAARPLSTWLMIAMLAIPAVIGTALLFFRSISIFFLPGKTWAAFAFICAALVLLGWRGGKRWMVLALPTAGYMVAIGVRQFFYSSADAPGFSLSLEARYALPFVLTVAVVIGFWFTKRVSNVDARYWLGLLLAAPVCGLVAGHVSALHHGAFDQHLSLADLYRHYFRGMWITPGALSIVFLLALPLANRFGSKAALLLIGYHFSDSIGLAATLWMEFYQRMAAVLFLVAFLVVIPVWMLKSTSPQHERRRTL
jgi:hypothetical protein